VEQPTHWDLGKATKRGCPVDRATTPRTWTAPLRRNELEAVQPAGEMLASRCSVVVIAEDVTPELARATIASIRVLGALQANPEVKVELRDRIH
jgi:hypothetical protein